MKGARQAQSAAAEQPDRHGDVVREQGNVALASKTYLTHAQAAEYLGLTVKALQRRMERRTIPVWTWTRLGSQSRRFVRASLDEWLGQRRHALTVVQRPRTRQNKSFAGGR